MAGVNEQTNWATEIYQFETEDPVEGGPDGIDNLPAKQLAGRTNWLRGLIKAVCDAQGVALNNNQATQLLTALDARFTTPTEVDDAIAVLSAALTAAINLKAPLNSPNLTGVPTAPTAAQSVNNTQVATTAFVKAAINALINAAPGALDTLDELAAALGDDPNFATTITNALAAKAPLASPALTGTPTAPTAAAGTNTTQVATTAFVAGVNTALTALINAKAPLASPAFTGTPTVPTAGAGTNTTQAASTAFVTAAINALISAAPGALDTLNELAAALGDDPNFATTMTNALAAKAPLNSPALTGTPTVPTAAQTVNNTQAASTAYVKAAINAIGTLNKASLAEILAGIDDSKYVTAAGLLGGLLGAGGQEPNDYVTFPYRDKTSGIRRNLIIQYGVVTGITSNTIINVVFPIAFPTRYFHLSLFDITGSTDNAGGQNNPKITSAVGNTGFSALYSRSSTGNFSWMAIGF